MKRFKEYNTTKTANINVEKAKPEHLKNALVQARRDLMAAKTKDEKEFHMRKIAALGSLEEDGEPNKIRFTGYEPHTAYGFKGGKVLARRSGSSAGGNGGGSGNGGGGGGNGLEEQYIMEMASSVEEELLGHLTHTKDIAHEDPRLASQSVDLLDQFHKLRQGLPSTISASLKHDGGASIHIMRDKRGRLGVSDKHRYARGVVAYTPEDIDKHFGHQPTYAAALKHVLTHGREVVGRGVHLQGDLLWTPGDTNTRQWAGTTTYTPNRITYKTQSKAPVGIAIHTQVTNGVAHTPTKGAVGTGKNIHIPQYEYTPDPHNYSEEARNAVEHHLSKAREILASHDTSHLTPEHITNFTIYNNRATRRGERPSLEGYVKHLKDEGEKAASKMKTPIGQERKRGSYQRLIDHAKQNQEGFGRSMAVRHHLAQATEYALSNLSHPDLKTSVDGKPSAGEGIVLGVKDGQGRVRPVSKLVPEGIQRALGFNPRFGREQQKS